MGEIYSSRWTIKNGSAPSDLWIAQVGNLSSAQMTGICNVMVARCATGNSWPPDLAEFVALVAENSQTALGLKTSDVMSEYWRWRNETYRYGSAEHFPWRHDVLYQICTEMRRTGTERQMTERELEGLAGRLLAKWEKHVNSGFSIPPVRRQLERPRHPAGPTPAQLLLEQYRRQKAATENAGGAGNSKSGRH
ncbi:replication protein [Pantoea sp. Bo_2]|nr:replication protein [Pantoea sp. VH_3]KAA5949696.1 replication protein [Pantoea sp. VH_25]KAA5955422.1 replication protein [Pantoea sp. VH_24]KAA5958957.1 replication protein [Pantoea sp. VH_16]KAA5964155.1 replication protein [Pantoea sp. VH_18]KAA5979076.1 replication protein [Pantoea sp. M_3]KAA5995365.1 replication protein [Pantoea sp. M_1]KAA6002422.1 replication protein [Pantoea sp. F_7]KAA6010342.1 replication protein [Pantoea sp. F_18]KAA6012645.1 replication protein [Pantoea sp